MLLGQNPKSPPRLFEFQGADSIGFPMPQPHGSVLCLLGICFISSLLPLFLQNFTGMNEDLSAVGQGCMRAVRKGSMS